MPREPYPTSNDPLVQAVQRLLIAHGGHIAVGQRAGIGDQTLYQIAFGKINSRTQKPQGVGPSVRKRLDAAFPGWLDKTPSLAVMESQATYHVRDLAEQIADAICSLPPARWASVRAQLDTLATHPEMRDDVLPELRALLAPGFADKRPGARG